jgi:2-dehydropantoate 2-reductase
VQVATRAALAIVAELGGGTTCIDEHIAWTERATGLRTSTMVDRERGRTMESDGLLGVIVRKGRAAGVETPCAATVYALLRAIDER